LLTCDFVSQKQFEGDSKMKKMLRLALTTCVVALAASALHVTRADSAFPALLKLPDKIAGGRPVTISVTNKPPASDAVSLKEWTDQVGRFEKAYPNVTVNGLEYTYTPDSFAALVAGKQVPTLFQVYLTDPQKYIDAGVAADISTIFDANKLRDAFNPDIINLAIKGNKVYGIPYGAYAMGLGYNISMLKAANISAAPTNWDDLRKDAKALTKRDAGVVGFSFINDGSGAAGWHFTIISYTFGAKPSDIIKLGSDGKYTAGFGAGPTVDALKFIHDLRWTDDVIPYETIDWPGNGTALATGKAAMVLMAGDQYSWIKRTYKDVDLTNIGFAPIPAGPGGAVSLVGGNMYMVSSAASDDEKEAATYFELWKLLDPNEDKASLEAQKADANPTVGGPDLPLFTGDYQKARIAFEKPYYTMPYDNYSAFIDAVSTGKVKLQVEPTPAGQEYYSAVGAVLSSIVTDKTIDPASALAVAAKTFQTTQLDHLGAK
jgi:ABC-type glycerol-3-phosphate transport system substrate-binding protein